MKTKFLILLMLLGNSMFSQEFANTKQTQEILDASKKFLLEKKEMDIELPMITFSIRELINNNELKYNTKGIYRLFTNKSPSSTYIVLKDKDKFQIIDLRSFSKNIVVISDFLSSRFDDTIVAQYLEEILKIYKYNRYDEKIKM
ncbi:hypothetical protein SGQ83_09080 [Flavobacterium sp. Fl-318]|uniref:Uncharacterized protein n=1 Tax=Flavobacterium cupriresistens TaxID=2893885 RepID=A0ABU4RAA4_9FLAO|nr:MULTISPECIES: hypothetical protein [unclassified Flavobacterium]MDX6189499.1 hypothetical protein [Flavobacterium sp. Fl-318]UFH41092.1 hypothetical protein LNP23_14875 [Flavobacterium sp. F-323]